jgi:hypothetical protein
MSQPSEHLVFEVVSTESIGHAARKAAKLSARGVRRVFAIDVERSRALEWSAELGSLPRGTWPSIMRSDNGSSTNTMHYGSNTGSYARPPV